MMALLAATAAAFALIATLLRRTRVRAIRHRVADPGCSGLPHLLIRRPAFNADRRALGRTAFSTIGVATAFGPAAGVFP
jgi:Fe-S cluster assembly iron-binding protein IscA